MAAGWDALVYGGTASGILAALAAARAGWRVAVQRALVGEGQVLAV